MFDIGKAFAEDALVSQSNRCLLPFFRFCALEGFFDDILTCLDTGNFFSIIVYLEDFHFNERLVSVQCKMCYAKRNQ